MLLIICGFTLLTACSKEESLNGNESLLEEKNLKLVEQLTDKEKKIIELKKNIEQLNLQIDDFNMEKEHFVFISNISREFIQAHTTGDKEKLSQLLSEDVVLVEKENKLYAIVSSDGFEWLLFNNEAKNQFVDWVIQGYDYDGKTNTFNIFIRELYIDSNGETESPPTFLNLTLKMYNNEWKIDSLGFDV